MRLRMMVVLLAALSPWAAKAAAPGQQPGLAEEPASARASDGARDPAQYSVKSLHAYPWCHGKGKVGNQDLLNETPLELGSITWTGRYECPSDVTLLVAEIERPPKDGRKPATLTLTAKSSSRILAQQSTQTDALFFPSRWTTIHAPMLIFGTGCEPVEVEAKVTVGKTVVGSMKKTIDFRCGEDPWGKETGTIRHDEGESSK